KVGAAPSDQGARPRLPSGRPVAAPDDGRVQTTTCKVVTVTSRGARTWRPEFAPATCAAPGLHRLMTRRHPCTPGTRPAPHDPADPGTSCAAWTSWIGLRRRR